MTEAIELPEIKVSLNLPMYDDQAIESLVKIINASTPRIPVTDTAAVPVLTKNVIGEVMSAERSDQAVNLTMYLKPNCQQFSDIKSGQVIMSGRVVRRDVKDDGSAESTAVESVDSVFGLLVEKPDGA